MPTRRFFPIHLSTAVMLMLVAGVLVWANVRENEQQGYRPYGPVIEAWLQQKGQPWELIITSYGWPCDCLERLAGTKISTEWDVKNVIYNALIALTILLSLCIACEWRFRRTARGAEGERMNSKRRFFQIHLGTAIVLMLVAGVLLGANMRKGAPPPIKKSTISYIMMGNSIAIPKHGYGWPETYLYSYEMNYERWNTQAIPINIACAIFILCAIWQVCEWLIRRRAVPPQ